MHGVTNYRSNPNCAYVPDLLSSVGEALKCKNFEVAIQICRAILATPGAKDIAEVQYVWGKLLLDGNGIERDVFQAINYLSNASQQGHVEARKLLLIGAAEILLGGDLTPGGFSQALRCLNNMASTQQIYGGASLFLWTFLDDLFHSIALNHERSWKEELPDELQEKLVRIILSRKEETGPESVTITWIDICALWQQIYLKHASDEKAKEIFNTIFNSDDLRLVLAKGVDAYNKRENKHVVIEVDDYALNELPNDIWRCIGGYLPPTNLKQLTTTSLAFEHKPLKWMSVSVDFDSLTNNSINALFNNYQRLGPLSLTMYIKADTFDGRQLFKDFCSILDRNLTKMIIEPVFFGCYIDSQLISDITLLRSGDAKIITTAEKIFINSVANAVDKQMEAISLDISFLPEMGISTEEQVKALVSACSFEQLSNLTSLTFHFRKPADFAVSDDSDTTSFDLHDSDTIAFDPHDRYTIAFTFISEIIKVVPVEKLAKLYLNFSGDVPSSLISNLERMTNLTSLKLENNQLFEDAQECFAKVAGKLQKLAILDLTKCLLDGECWFDEECGFDGGPVAMLKALPLTITELTFKDTTLFEKETADLIEGLPKLSSLKQLTLPEIGHSQTVALIRALPGGLTCLDVSACSFDEDGAAALKERLPGRVNLTDLSLPRHNLIPFRTQDEEQVFADLIMALPQGLTNLNLSFYGLLSYGRRIGFEALLKKLPELSKLQRLYVEGNELKDGDVADLIEVCLKLPSLTWVDCISTDYSHILTKETPASQRLGHYLELWWKRSQSSPA